MIDSVLKYFSITKIIVSIFKPLTKLGNNLLDITAIIYNRCRWICFCDIVFDFSNTFLFTLKCKRDYIIDKRITKYVFYCDGHFILINEYKIFPLTNGKLEIPKGFKTSNPDYTDFSKFMKYNTLKDNCKRKSRFKHYLINVEKLSSFDGLIKIIHLKADKDIVRFKIFIEGAKRFQPIKFMLMMSIPKEFKNRANLNDVIELNEPKQYGTIQLTMQADKYTDLVDKFAPILYFETENGRKIEIPEKSKNKLKPFYLEKTWKIRRIISKKIIIEHHEA